MAIDKAKESSKAATGGMTRTKDGLNVIEKGKSSSGYAGSIGASIPSEGEAGKTGGSPTSSAPSGTTATGSSSKGGIVDNATKALLEQISKGEGTSDTDAQRKGFANSYDLPLGAGAFGRPDKPISSMTLGELKEYQKVLLKNSGKLNSSAVGKYQIVGTTIREMQKRLKLGDDVVFSSDVQDKMAVELLKGRGLNKYLSGNMSARDFQANLYHEWASIAHPDTGKAKQHTGTKNEQIQPLLNALRGGKGEAKPSNDAGINYVSTTAQQNASRSDSGAIKPVGYSPGSPSSTNAPSPVIAAPRDTQSIQSQAYRTEAPSAPTRVQPEIRRNEQEFAKSVTNMTTVLTDSLNVQRSILSVLQGMASSNTSGMTTSSGNTGTIDPSRIAKPVADSPITVKNRVMT